MDKRFTKEELETIRKYSDIIDENRPASLKHPAMDIKKRAASFSPFAALNGFEDTVKDAQKQYVSDLERMGEHLEKM